MDIKKLIQYNQFGPYEKGSHQMWTDPYISKQLLKYHLNPNIDVASRSRSNINSTVNWILNELNKTDVTILDLGCGPGLYCEQFAKLNYQVTGIDWSENSINYAIKNASENNLNIKYICDNYLNISFKEKFDMIMMIYCDFGVLSIDEQRKLIELVNANLKDDGIFIFDAYNPKILESRTFQKDYEIKESGFWSDKPYLCLSESQHFPNNQVILDQHIVINEQEVVKVYRFWEHYYEVADIEKIFNDFDFKEINSYFDILKDQSHINFYKIRK